VVHAAELLVLQAAGEGASGRRGLADEPLLDPREDLLLLGGAFADPVLGFALPRQRIEVLQAQIGLFNDRVERCECLMGQQLLDLGPLVQYRHASLMEL
jgi:hypothetical protein